MYIDYHILKHRRTFCLIYYSVHSRKKVPTINKLIKINFALNGRIPQKNFELQAFAHYLQGSSNQMYPVGYNIA